jgi:hypothetical protein
MTDLPPPPFGGGLPAAFLGVPAALQDLAGVPAALQALAGDLAAINVTLAGLAAQIVRSSNLSAFQPGHALQPMPNAANVLPAAAAAPVWYPATLQNLTAMGGAKQFQQCKSKRVVELLRTACGARQCARSETRSYRSSHWCASRTIVRCISTTSATRSFGPGP